ncbi:MAG: electron transfer flavoprotein-ubiquinone oxidoreductase [Desulfatirhabdiaceae bacterium]
MPIERETIPFDVLFVGGGPANLAGAIRLMQLAREKNLELEVALIEKGSEIGSHALSGAILNPRSLAELIPDFMEKGCPVENRVRQDAFYYLTRDKAFHVPVVPHYMHNQGFYIVSQSRLTRWLAGIAEEMGVNIFSGFAGKEPLFSNDGTGILGVRIGDKGIGKDGAHRSNFEPGVDLTASVTVFGEGARGSLFQEIAKKLGIDSGKMPQVYETGIKEVIQLPDEHYFTRSQANDIHFMGYPVGLYTPGGGFIYEMADNRISLGFLTGLSYDDPFIDPYDMLLRFKRHPLVMDIIRGGKVIEQGARTVSNGGFFTIPQLSVDGAVFVGGSAAMQNVPGLKGIHTAMKSGMLAAEAIIQAIEANDFTRHTLDRYTELFDQSWLRTEIFEGRNFAAALAKKGPAKYIHLAAQYVTDGKGIRDVMPLEADYQTLKAIDSRNASGTSDKSTVDGVLLVDKLTGVYLSRTLHREDQPSHLLVHDLNICVNQCYETYRNPCTRFCPAQVYEFHIDETTSRRELRVNPSNCLHCKTCDIKDPYRNITWTCPEGGDGPGYKLV